MSTRRWTDDDLREAVLKSESLAQVIKWLGLALDRTTHSIQSFVKDRLTKQVTYFPLSYVKVIEIEDVNDVD